jgi:hypothetical protein
MKKLGDILFSFIVIGGLATILFAIGLLPMYLAVAFCSGWWMLLYLLYLIIFVVVASISSDGIPSK